MLETSYKVNGYVLKINKRIIKLVINKLKIIDHLRHYNETVVKLTCNLNIEFSQ